MDEVVIHGLREQTHLNGRVGRIIERKESRLVVELDCSKQISVRFQNVRTRVGEEETTVETTVEKKRRRRETVDLESTAAACVEVGVWPSIAHADAAFADHEGSWKRAVAAEGWTVTRIQAPTFDDDADGYLVMGITNNRWAKKRGRAAVWQPLKYPRKAADAPAKDDPSDWQHTIAVIGKQVHDYSHVQVPLSCLWLGHDNAPDPEKGYMRTVSGVFRLHKRRILPQDGDYYSQDASTCGEDLPRACGPCAIANALKLTNAARQPTPLQLCAMFREKGIFRAGRMGCVAQEVANFVQAYLRKQAMVVPASLFHRVALAPGAVLSLSSVALKNAQDLCQFHLSEENDFHFVTVESVEGDTVVVINPDTRPTETCARCDEEDCTCFEDGTWGRMRVDIPTLTRICHSAVMW